MKKKILVGIALMVLCLSFSISAFALTEGDWEFQLLDDEVTITGYLGEGGDVVIPSEIYGRPVTEMNEHVFDSVSNTIKSITYPSTIEIIETVSWNWYDFTGPETIILSEGVTEIGTGAFQRMTNLKYVQLPSTLTKIHEGAFSGCKSLKNIEIPANVQYIGDSVFENSGLTSIDLSHINASLGAFLFAECSNLIDVKLNRNLTEIKECTFLSCKSLKNIDLPEGIITIKGSAFRDCSALEGIILPTTLKEIKSGAFAGCTSFTEVVIPYGTTTIENGGKYIYDAFEYCDNLQSIYIPDTVTTLGADFIGDNNKCIVYCAADSYAAQICKKYKISYLTDNSVNSLITVYYNGTRVSFHEQGQNPELINSRTLVPLRAIFEAMDAEVEWNQETKTVTATRDGVEISISIGANVMYKDGEEIEVDVPAQLINDRTMVPVRVIAEAFGADVEWNNNGRAVLIEE